MCGRIRTRKEDVCLKQFTIFTDGSCLGNPGPGGYAYIVRDSAGHEKEDTGGAPATTNNRMELLAALRALESLREPSEIKLYSDSNYLVKGMTEWIHGWKERGWKNSQKKPVENQDLWKLLDTVSKKHKISWIWVEAHAGHPENERCDELARTQAEEFARLPL